MICRWHINDTSTCVTRRCAWSKRKKDFHPSSWVYVTWLIHICGVTLRSVIHLLPGDDHDQEGRTEPPPEFVSVCDVTRSYAWHDFGIAHSIWEVNSNCAARWKEVRGKRQNHTVKKPCESRLVLLCFIDPRVTKIRNEAPGDFFMTLTLVTHYQAIFMIKKREKNLHPGSWACVTWLIHMYGMTLISVIHTLPGDDDNQEERREPSPKFVIVCDMTHSTFNIVHLYVTLEFVSECSKRTSTWVRESFVGSIRDPFICVYI